MTAAAGLLGERCAVVLHVASLGVAAEGFAAAGSGGAGLERELLDDALARASAGAALARRAGFRAVPRATLAAPTWRGVVEVADDVDAEVIVIGSRRLRRLAEFVERSVWHEVAAHTGRPVLVVPRASRFRASHQTDYRYR